MKIAKQEIVNANNEVVAYEVLYRSGDLTLGQNSDDDITLDVIVASFLKIGYSNIAGNNERLAFNFANGDLLKNVSDSVMPQNVILEILETVPMDETLVKTLVKLKEKGFVIALDDFKTSLVKDHNVYKYVDIIKVDFMNSTREERREVENLKIEFPNITLLAEKIEDESQYLSAIKSGYTLFQGYFISKPMEVNVAT